MCRYLIFNASTQHLRIPLPALLKSCLQPKRMQCRLLKINPKGSVPAVKDLEEDKWFTDSADIVNHVEDKFPEPQLGKADSAPDVYALVP